MQKSSYYPSPLRKDYISKPVRNFNPIIVNDSSRSGTSREQNRELQKIARYEDGLLVKFVVTGNFEAGMFFHSNSSCIIYSMVQNKPQGKNYVIFPSGVIMSMNYQAGILNKWLIAVQKEKFIACQFYKKGIRQGEQYFYDFENKLLIISKYKKGKLEQIKDGIAGEFSSIVKNKEIIGRIEQLENKELQTNKNIPHLKILDYSYYGFLNDKKDAPHGHGILMGDKQIFMGSFNNGMLNGLGGIKFENGSFYYGNFSNGVCNGYGCRNNGKQITYKFEKETIEKKQFNQYLELVMVKDYQKKWATKYKDIEGFYQQFSFKQLKDKSTAKISQRSQINVDVIKTMREDNEKEDERQSDFQSQHQQTYTITKNIGQKIPKLSLCQTLSTKQKQKTGGMTERERLNIPKNIRKQSLTDRNLEVYLANEENFLKVPNKNDRYEHLGTEMMANDKYSVNWQSNYIRPHQMEIKQKINKTSITPGLIKNQGNVRLNFGKIMKIGSDVSDKKAERFIQKFTH